MRRLPVILVFLALAGCNAFPIPTPTPIFQETVTPEPSPVSPTPTEAPGARPTVKLSIWVPARFDPSLKTQTSTLLEKTIDDFESQNPGTEVEIRVKADANPAGLMESLTLTSAAAPDAMPSLALLSRSQMEEAARKNIIFPLDSLTVSLDQTDWYPFAKQLAIFKDDIYGLPLTGDVLVLVYRSSKPASQAPTWEEILNMGSTVLFAAADPQATVPIALYRSSGGNTEDILLNPEIQIVELEKTLTLLASGAEKNVFPPWLINYQTDKQVLDIFANQQGGWVITWLSNYLAVQPDNTSIYPIPTLGVESATLANGSVWALTDTNPERRLMSVRLAEHLTRSEFLSQWNLINNSLPPRPSALTSWPDSPLRSQLNQISLAAIIRPPGEVITTIGPAIQEATLLILKKQSDPAKAASTAQERLSASATN